MKAGTVFSAAVLRRAEARISAADSRMAEIISARGPLRGGKKEPPFHVLSVSIINQQLSQKVADVIESRVAKLTPAPFSAEGMAKVSPKKLRAAGLSERKAAYLGGLARRALDGSLPFSRFAKMEDEEIIELLVGAPGIGRWTAEMFLMFALGRPDIVSPGDGALQRAALNIYGKRYKGGAPEVLQKAAEKWRPYRTVGCRYLWKSLEKAKK